MSSAIIVPARYASTRFPGKPLAMLGGQTMVERTYMNAQKAADQIEDCVAWKVSADCVVLLFVSLCSVRL